MLKHINIYFETILLVLFLYMNLYMTNDSLISSHTDRCEDVVRCDNRRDYKYNK